MEEFLSKNYFFITHFVEIFAAVMGLLFYRKYKNSAGRYFIWFLVYVAIIELIGEYPRYVIKHEFLHFFKDLIEGTIIEKNKWFYTLFWSIGSAVFYAFYFQKVIESKKFVRFLKFSTLVFVLCSIVNISLNWDAFFMTNLPFIDILGMSLILLSIILYFVEVLQSTNVLTFHRTIHFYIGAVLFLWLLVTTPFVFYDVYFSQLDMDFVKLKALTILFSNIFMYVTFALTIIWCQPDEN